MVITIDFGVDEILDMVVMSKSDIVKRLLRRLKYYRDQDGNTMETESQSQSKSFSLLSYHSGQIYSYSDSDKDETAVDEACRRLNKGMRPN